ncbi:hypothetical protein F5B21DRAFT_480713 [Xylaria acuta]|nr:hypothetical protein F5B21DRAFT_480713 [Xylaria acuta]
MRWDRRIGAKSTRLFFSFPLYAFTVEFLCANAQNRRFEWEANTTGGSMTYCRIMRCSTVYIQANELWSGNLHKL